MRLSKDSCFKVTRKKFDSYISSFNVNTVLTPFFTGTAESQV